MSRFAQEKGNYNSQRNADNSEHAAFPEVRLVLACGSHGLAEKAAEQRTQQG
ncbi:hypothetical protein [Hymenobacter sp. YC55]|uniref:hypothetical protein n=1 Tax=Hymenobacter sp. YC55 TaxID=3034019 RepID=UPI0023F7FEBF|nr:hypothetical protein [Hymenobacter sp. YC55]MDF7811634.1 hypothetical protein [Hymenobacter sp. YC55]